MTETTAQTTLAGYRNAIMILREVAALTEQNPTIPQPKFTFDPAKDGVKAEVYYGLSEYHYDYMLSAEERNEQRRLRVENRINAVIEAFGPDLEWVSNDPSEDSFAKNYFVLKAEWKPGVEVRMMVSRDQIGEMVDVIESGPKVLEQDGMVQLVRQTATVWKPNITIGRRATPAYELERAPLTLALTESEVL